MSATRPVPATAPPRTPGEALERLAAALIDSAAAFVGRRVDGLAARLEESAARGGLGLTAALGAGRAAIRGRSAVLGALRATLAGMHPVPRAGLILGLIVAVLLAVLLAVVLLAVLLLAAIGVAISVQTRG